MLPIKDLIIDFHEDKNERNDQKTGGDRPLEDQQQVHYFLWLGRRIMFVLRHHAARTGFIQAHGT
jgi:hypothetical protein